MIRGTAPAQEEATAFLHEVSTGALDAALGHCVTDFKRTDLEKLAGMMAPWGQFEDVSFQGRKWKLVGSTLTWRFSGVANFQNAQKNVEFTLTVQGSEPKVCQFAFGL